MDTAERNAERFAIGRELEKCRKGGLLKPEAVIERARNPRSILHDRFTWDDTDAAHQYRLIEARNLIRVHVVQAAPDVKPVSVYVSLTQDRTKAGGGYRTLSEVMDDKQLYAQMRDDAFTVLQNAQMKYRNIMELAEVWEALERAKPKQADAA